MDETGAPHAYGAPVLFDTDDENAFRYTKRGGRKHEPRWSLPVAEGGFGIIDWKYPRPANFDCGPGPKWYMPWLKLLVAWPF